MDVNGQHPAGFNVNEANLRDALKRTTKELETWRQLAREGSEHLKNMVQQMQDWRTWACFWWIATMITFGGLLVECWRNHHG